MLERLSGSVKRDKTVKNTYTQGRVARFELVRLGVRRPQPWRDRDRAEAGLKLLKNVTVEGRDLQAGRREAPSTGLTGGKRWNCFLAAPIPEGHEGAAGVEFLCFGLLCFCFFFSPDGNRDAVWPT